jgi:hypothetical protein
VTFDWPVVTVTGMKYKLRLALASESSNQN